MLRYILFLKILLFSDCKKCHSSWKDLCGRLGGGAIVYSWECDILGRARGSLCVQPLLHHTLHLWVTFDAARCKCTLALTTPVKCAVHIIHQILFSARPQGSFLCRLYCTSPHCHYWYAVCIVFQLTSTQMSKFLWFDFQSQTMQIANHEVEVLLSKCCQKSPWIFVISTVLTTFQNMATSIPQQSMFCWNIASQLEYLSVKTGNTKSANLEPENAETVGILVQQLYLACEEGAQLCFCRQANMEWALLMLLLPPNHR